MQSHLRPFTRPSSPQHHHKYNTFNTHATSSRKSSQTILNSDRYALTLMELLIAISIVGVLCAIVLPAVTWSRETARRGQCLSNLKQMGIAIDAFQTAHQMYPPGGNDKGYSLHVSILPQIDQSPLFQSISDSNLDSEGNPANSILIPLYLCPSDPYGDLREKYNQAGTNYVGNFGSGLQRFGYNGMFRNHMGWGRHKGGPIRPADVDDGLSHTAMLTEILVGNTKGERLRTHWNTDHALDEPDELDEFAVLCKNWVPQRLPSGGWDGDEWFRGHPWIMGDVGSTMYNHVLTPNQLSCFNGSFVQEGIYTAASLHRGGVNLLYADGRGDFISENIDGKVWTDLGSRTSK